MPESSGDDVVAGFAIYQPDQNPGMGLNTEKDEKTLINERGQNICFCLSLHLRLLLLFCTM